MRLYYSNQAEIGHGNEKIDISSSKLTGLITEDTLVHDNLMDDSTNGAKYVRDCFEMTFSNE